jgi:sulfhydrogenase subunit delta
MAEELPKKIRIGWFSFSCCEDNTMVMLEVMNEHWQEWKKLFDFRHARVLQAKNVLDEMDIAFIEGAITAPQQEEMVKKIRQLAKKLVAVGSCAITGLPAGQRNYFTEEQKKNIEFILARFGALPQVLKVADIVPVDVEIPGCPMDPQVFLQKVNDLIKEFQNAHL